MREWGAEALTSLIKAGLTFSHEPPLSQKQVKTMLNIKSSTSKCTFMLNNQLDILLIEDF
jgi:hypothetical protein